jgi:hypothetical protein
LRNILDHAVVKRIILTNPAGVRAAAIALEEELIGTTGKQFEQVLNRSEFEDEMQVIDNFGATLRA